MKVSDSAVQVIPLKNNTDHEIQITGYHHHDDAFTILNDFPFAIGAGQEHDLYCLFHPDTIGYFHDILTIQSDINTPELTQRIARQVLTEGISSLDAGIPVVPKKLTVDLFPNPHNGTFQLDFGTEGFYEISIINLAGETIQTERTSSTTYISNYLNDKLSGNYILYIMDLNSGKSCYLKTIKL